MTENLIDLRAPEELTTLDDALTWCGQRIARALVRTDGGGRLLTPELSEAEWVSSGGAAAFPGG